MSGTREGGLRASKTNRLKYGEDFYKRNGARGGARSTTGGFASRIVGKDGLTGKQRSSIAGRLGGTRSKRPRLMQAGEDVQEPA